MKIWEKAPYARQSWRADFAMTEHGEHRVAIRKEQNSTTWSYKPERRKRVARRRTFGGITGIARIEAPTYTFSNVC